MISNESHNRHNVVSTPVGLLTIVAGCDGITAVLWENDPPTRVRVDHGKRDEHDPVLNAAAKQLEDYFAGRRNQFELPLQFQGTDFQRKVWNIMLSIPYGETLTYGEIACAIGNPNAARAVGACIGKNPISIIGPCHRVIGASGSLTGFAGGLENKKYLLELESHATKTLRR